MMGDERIVELEKRVELLEFKVQLLSENSNVSKLLLEYDITYNQYIKLMDLMDKLRASIESGMEEVHHSTFEQKVYKITGKDGDYHFCEFLARAFMEDGRWEEVFPVLYGHMTKYKYYMEKRRKGEQ